jgi:hypothetical protein
VSGQQALHCSRLSAHLSGLNGVAYPHVLQAIIAQVQVPWKHASVPWEHASLAT